MTMEQQTTTAFDHDAADAELQQKAKDHLWMHFARQSVLEEHGAPIIVQGRGSPHLGLEGQEVHRRALRALRRQRGPRPTPARAGGGEAGGAARLLPDLVVRASVRDRARRPPRRLRARRPQPGVLLHGRRRGRRDRLQARQVLLEAAGPADQAQGHLPRDRVPRHPAGRPRDHRHPRHEGDVRAGDARRLPGAEHQLLPRARDGLRRNRRGVRPLGREPHRGADPLRGAGDRRGGVPRAGAELAADASRLRPATSSGCARSATSTTCCSSRTR